MIKYSFSILVLFIIIFPSNFGAEKRDRNHKQLVDHLTNEIAEFCTSSNGPDSGFCEDYAKLRRARASNAPNAPNATVTTPEEIINRTAAAERPEPIKEKPGDIVFQEGNKTTVIDPKDTTGPDEEIAGLTAQQIREELRKIIQEESQRKTIQKLEDDPACSNLRDEYDEVCFATPPLAAFQETREFCLAFVKNCQNSLLTNIFTNVKNFKVDFTAYCKKHRERFRYVCPNPLRFQSFAEDAVNFCVRYKERCPSEPVPAEPVQFHRKDEGHIYTREIEFWCTRQKRTAYNYCTEPDLLKVPKYMWFCGMYKYQCIDVYKRVIYG